jgi:hypothetical protein
MNTIDKVSRDAKIFSDSISDTLVTNLLTANQDSSLGINLSEDQLSKVFRILNASIDQAYQKALPHFQNTIKKHF